MITIWGLIFIHSNNGTDTIIKIIFIILKRYSWEVKQNIQVSKQLYRCFCMSTHKKILEGYCSFINYYKYLFSAYYVPGRVPVARSVYSNGKKLDIFYVHRYFLCT